MKLCLATEKDAKLYRKMRNADDTYHWFYSQQQFTLKEVKDWLKTRDINVDRVYMAEEDGKVVGTCSLYNVDWDERRAEVGRIIVMGKFRGQGLGTKILIEIIEAAKELSLKHIYAHIKENNRSSQRAFIKAGFTLTMDGTLAVKYLY